MGLAGHSGGAGYMEATQKTPGEVESRGAQRLQPTTLNVQVLCSAERQAEACSISRPWGVSPIGQDGTAAGSHSQ